MNYTVTYTEQAIRDLSRLPAKVQLAGDVKKLNATVNLYRLRSGDFRVIFTLNGSIVVILRISDRKEAYD